jgi:hypothetical protein
MFEAWQAQQKALKVEDRKAKSAATAALQNYRRDNLSEEETKLAALREQERLQKLEAERQLHDYRAHLSEEEAKLAAQRQEELRKKQLMEEQLRNNGVVTANQHQGVHASLKGMENSGAVSAIAAQYTSPTKEQQHVSSSKLSQVATPPLVPDAISTVTYFDATASVVSNGYLQDSSCPMDMESVMPGPVTAPAIEPSRPTLPTVVSSTPISTHISFLFGVITVTEAPPHVDGYLAKTDEIVKTVVMDNPDTFASLASNVGYPLVSSVQKDASKFVWDGRPRRLLLVCTFALLVTHVLVFVSLSPCSTNRCPPVHGDSRHPFYSTIFRHGLIVSTSRVGGYSKCHFQRHLYERLDKHKGRSTDNAKNATLLNYNHKNYIVTTSVICQIVCCLSFLSRILCRRRRQ